MALSEAELNAVMALAESRGCYLLLDETYREMNFAGPTPLAASISRRAISVASMSKSYGLPGIRIGWIISRDEALQEMFLAAKEQIFICNSVVDEEIAFHVLNRKSQVLPPILERNRRGFEITRAWMAQQNGMEWVPPAGGVVCFPRIRAAAASNVDGSMRFSMTNTAPSWGQATGLAWSAATCAWATAGLRWRSWPKGCKTFLWPWKKRTAARFERKLR